MLLVQGAPVRPVWDFCETDSIQLTPSWHIRPVNCISLLFTGKSLLLTSNYTRWVNNLGDIQPVHIRRGKLILLVLLDCGGMLKSHLNTLAHRLSLSTL